MKTTIQYNRNSKHWQAVNGETRTFAAGKDGKRAAMLVALSIDHNKLYRAVAEIIIAHRGSDDIKALIDRLINAAKLLVHNYAYAGGRVKSQSDQDTVYQTSWGGQPASYHCTCPDWEHGLMKSSGVMRHGAPATAYGHLCKHSAAQLLAWLTDWPLDDEAIPVEVKRPVATAQPTKQERASGHFNANLSAEEKAALLAKAQREQAAARKRLARMGNGNYNGYGGPKQRDTALPASVDERSSIEDWLG